MELVGVMTRRRRSKCRGLVFPKRATDVGKRKGIMVKREGKDIKRKRKKKGIRNVNREGEREGEGVYVCVCV